MKRNAKAYDYGNCHVCGARLVERRVDQAHRANGRWVVVRKVPVGKCAQCGEGVVRAEVLKRVEELLRAKRGRRLVVRAVQWSPAKA